MWYGHPTRAVTGRLEGISFVIRFLHRLLSFLWFDLNFSLLSLLGKGLNRRVTTSEYWVITSMVKVPLHFVGQATYKLESFIAEAKKLGVARAIPKNIAKNLEFGDIILLAIFKSHKEKDKKKTKRVGKAYVFGYFIIEGLNVNHEIMEEAEKDLNIKYTSNITVTVVRGCGSYVISGTSIVENTLKEVIEAIEKAERKLKKKAKIFLTGRFVPVKPFVLRDIPFTRSIIYVDLPEATMKRMKVDLPQVFKIRDYERVTRRTKKEKEAPLHKPLDEFIQGDIRNG